LHHSFEVIDRAIDVLGAQNAGQEAAEVRRIRSVEQTGGDTSDSRPAASAWPAPTPRPSPSFGAQVSSDHSRRIRLKAYHGLAPRRANELGLPRHYCRAFNNRSYAAFSHRRNRVGWARCSSFGRARVDERYTSAQPKSASAKLVMNIVASCASLFIESQPATTSRWPDRRPSAKATVSHARELRATPTTNTVGAARQIQSGKLKIRPAQSAMKKCRQPARRKGGHDGCYLLKYFRRRLQRRLS
jgi:hypothetical protein